MRSRGPAVLATVLVTLSGACANAATQQADTGPDRDKAGALDSALETITPAEMYDRIAFLASDELAGRDTPSPGLEQAAEYLVRQFEALGLEPGGESGTFLQRYRFPIRALDTLSVHFAIVSEDGTELGALEHGVEYWARPAFEPEDRDMRHGSLVYLGSGRESLSSSASFAGRVVVVDLPGGLDASWRSTEAALRRFAVDGGASGLVIGLDAAFPEAGIAQFARLAGRPRRELVDPFEVPTFYVEHDAAERVLRRGGVDPAAAVPRSGTELAGVSAHFAAIPEVLDDARAPNVVAILPGSDPELRDTYVVFSAHMDHVGIGTADAEGDSIYNGADDDASGTAALVEVAGAFTALSSRPVRSLMFLAVSGEEKGLLGSRYFSDNPTVPVASIVANINVDMIARNAPDSIVVIGQEYSSLGPLVRSIATDHPELGLVVVPDPWPEERFFFRSDHFNFARQEIPALFFFSGVHEDYHRPSDEVERIDPGKAARVARLIFLTAHAIASDAQPPTWTAEGLEEVRALTR